MKITKTSLQLTLIFTAFLLGFSQNLFSQQTADLEKITLQSNVLNQKRPVFIYTPWNYKERDLVSFDVIYVFDAQNREIFDLVHAAAHFIFEQRKFIVVGISSPSYDDLEYYRNSDYLPKPIHVTLDKYMTDKPNAENFSKYFTEEVIPFIEKNYRTTGTKYLVGHSLSASFVLDKALHAANQFNGFICISPNLAYDDFRLADAFLKTNFNQPDQRKFLYLSQSNEPKTWAKPWGVAYEKVKNFIDTKNDFGKYDIVIKEFPQNGHLDGYLPSLVEGLKSLNNFIDNNPYVLSAASEEVTFKVTVPNKNDEAFLTGNQVGLGNWDPSKIKLNKVSDFEREIKVTVQFPVEFKLTKGTWQTEGNTNQTTQANENIVITKAPDKEIKLKVLGWNN